jgi:hypothetical protein
MATAVAWPWAATLGFPLVGIGLSNVVPAVYSAAGRRGSTPADGITLAATAGYGGFLAGPVVIGATSQMVGLRAGLSLLIGCASVVALLGGATPESFD